MQFVEGIHYKKIDVGKYKYELLHTHVYTLNCFQQFENDYIKLEYDKLTIKKGYQWDGATAFPDVKSILRASLIHDVFYQIIRESNFKKNEKKALKEYADIRLKDFCIEDGMLPSLASSVKFGVATFGSIFGKL